MKVKLTPPGSTKERPIIVVESGSGKGIRTEFAHLHRMFGNRWRLLRQFLVRDAERSYDVMVVQVGRRTETVYFDITSFIPPMPPKNATSRSR